MVYGVWCMVYGQWCMVYGVWCMVYGQWCMVYGVWCMVYGVWSMVYGVWCVVWGGGPESGEVEGGGYSCITHDKAQGPSRIGNESKSDEKSLGTQTRELIA